MEPKPQLSLFSPPPTLRYRNRYRYRIPIQQPNPSSLRPLCSLRQNPISLVVVSPKSLSLTSGEIPLLNPLRPSRALREIIHAQWQPSPTQALRRCVSARENPTQVEPSTKLAEKLPPRFFAEQPRGGLAYNLNFEITIKILTSFDLTKTWPTRRSALQFCE